MTPEAKQYTTELQNLVPAHPGWVAVVRYVANDPATAATIVTKELRIPVPAWGLIKHSRVHGSSLEMEAMFPLGTSMTYGSECRRNHKYAQPEDGPSVDVYVELEFNQTAMPVSVAKYLVPVGEQPGYDLPAWCGTCGSENPEGAKGSKAYRWITVDGVPQECADCHPEGIARCVADSAHLEECGSTVEK